MNIKSFVELFEEPAARLELYSSAYSLSDMEIFVFPQLLYSLVLANIINQKLWTWRDDPWFQGIREQKPERRVQRVKQYIMDNYTFNLDLETWGLTTRETELERFSDYVDEDILRESNALFGYEGDKYYFSIDIRRHFGLDKYTSNVIPYWKTETMQSMDAFIRKPGWTSGGGECVSLAALYAAALFVVAGIPLDQIWLFATPLHSQNYLDIGAGILTNNRRIVTKNMFFNGSELSQKARRALENEKITVVAHRTGWIHTIYPESTIEMQAYGRFGQQLSRYLRASFTPEVFGNFIRCHSQFQRCFAYRYRARGASEDLYIECEKALRYEEESKFRVSDSTRKKLLEMIDRDEFYSSPLPGRLVVDDLEDFIKREKIDFDKPGDCFLLRSRFCRECLESCEIIAALKSFIRIIPRLPDVDRKIQLPAKPIELEPEMDREEIIAWLEKERENNLTADLAFHAARIPGDWYEPYWLAALKRNPVCVSESASLESWDDLAREIESLDGESIFDASGLAQPDEVWNFKTGDGFEKAACFVTIIRARGAKDLSLSTAGLVARVKSEGREWSFSGQRELGTRQWSFE